MGPKKKWTGQYQAKRPMVQEEQQHDKDGNRVSGNDGSKKPRRAVAINLGNVKGHQAVFGTCNVRHTRQATAELVDMLNSVADDMYPETTEHDDAAKGGGPAAGASSIVTTTDTEKKSGNGAGEGDGAEAKIPASSAEGAAPSSHAAAEISVEEMVRQEADALRSGSDRTHRFKAVDTAVKGVVMVCVMDPKVDILRLVDALYDEIRATKMRRSRFLERVTPMQVTAYPELEAIKEAVERVISAALPPVAEGVPPLPVVARATAANDSNGAKTETTPTPAKSGGDVGTAETEAAATAVTKVGAEEGASAATSAAGAAATNGIGNQAFSTATAISVGAGGSAAHASGDKQSGVVDDGKERKRCDKRWKYRVDVRRRNSALDRMDLINVVAGSVGAGHSVNMSSPEVTIVVEAVKSVVGMSVLFNFALNHEYSISRLQDAVCDAILDS